MGGQRVAGEQDVDVAGAHQPDHRRGGTGVHDSRPADPEDASSGGLDLPHPLGDLVDEQRLRLLAGDGGGHEAEVLLLAARRRRRHLHADAVRAADDRLARLHVADRHVPHHLAAVLLLDDQSAVHLGAVHVQPLPVQPDEGVEVRRRVEVVREDAVGQGGAGRRGAGVHRVRAVHLESHDDALEQFRLVGPDLHQRPRLVPVLAAQVEALDAVVTAVLEDVVEDAGEDAGVHQVSGQGDGLGEGAHGAYEASSGRPRRRLRRRCPSSLGPVPHPGHQHRDASGDRGHAEDQPDVRGAAAAPRARR